MLIIKVQSGEKIERALKRYRTKFKKTKQLKQLRNNQYFTKKSQEKRETLAKAQYKEAYERAKEI